MKADTARPRHDRIGSGDIASILGFDDAFGSPYSVWYQKHYKVDDNEETELMWWGSALEPVILDRYTIRSPEVSVIDRQVHFTYPDWPIATATVDAILASDDVCVAEVKTSSFDVYDGLPIRIQAQCQWQMGVSGIHRCVALVLFYQQVSRGVQVFQVDYDETAFGTMLHRAKKFWTEHVVTGVAPEPDAHRATTATLKRFAPVERVVDIDHLNDSLKQLGDVRAALAELKKTDTLHVNKIRDALGSATVGQIGGKDAVTWRPTKTGSRTFRIKKAFLPQGADDE